MSAPDLRLLAKRRYGPLFAVQFGGAFNDNLFKFALLFLADFTLYADAPGRAERLATIATGLFTLPYFLFSAWAGQVADAWDKTKLIRCVKAAEVGIMTFALAGFWLQSMPVLLTCLFLMGMHSTVFGPAKYAVLPQHLGRHELMGGTGLIEAGTFLAILAGQLAGGVIAPWQAGLVAVGVALLGLLASFAMPLAPSAAPGMRIERNPFKGTLSILSVARSGRGVWLAILGISWFFSIGAILLSEFAPLVSNTLGAGPGVVTLFLLVFSVSVALGSVTVNRLLGGEVSARYVPVAALVLAAGQVDLWLSTRRFVPAVRGANVHAFLATAGSWHVLFDLAAIAFAGGVFVVPLYAVLQTQSSPDQRSRVIAANNIVNASVTVALVAIATALLATGTSVPGVIGTMGFATLAVALISCWLLPETLVKALIRGALRLLYRVEVAGRENMPQPGERAVVVVNHVSFLDGLLLAAFLPGRPTFAVHSRIAKAWWMKPFLGLFDAFLVDPTNPMATKAMVKAVREGRTLVIFPEGRITVTGALMKVFDGPGMVADKADARRTYAEKFGLRILEGYGATEAGPVIAVNTPMHFQAGSVGRLLPGITAELTQVPGITEGGRLAIRGPNIMAGYLKADAPGVLQPPAGGWHDTGDIVTIDPAGFVTIRGRAKRFAKIGGEMVSLPAVEGYAAQLWPGSEHAVVTRPDAKKGEQLVLFTTQADAALPPLQAWARAHGVAELMLPREIRRVDALPVLGTGKLDYVTMGQLASAAPPAAPPEEQTELVA